MLGNCEIVLFVVKTNKLCGSTQSPHKNHRYFMLLIYLRYRKFAWCENDVRNIHNYSKKRTAAPRTELQKVFPFCSKDFNLKTTLTGHVITFDRFNLFIFYKLLLSSRSLNEHCHGDFAACWPKQLNHLTKNLFLI